MTIACEAHDTVIGYICNHEDDGLVKNCIRNNDFTWEGRILYQSYPQYTMEVTRSNV